MVNLLNFNFFKKLVQKSFFPTILRIIAIPVFILLIIYLIIGPEKNNIANLIIWIIWWPALLFLNAIAPRSWCKYLCPLGRMLSLFSPISIMELRSNKNICFNQCITYDCIKNDNCPMGIHPSATVNNYECIFCLSCIKKCSYKAIHITARFPWHGVLENKNWQMVG